MVNIGFFLRVFVNRAPAADTGTDFWTGYNVGVKVRSHWMRCVAVRLVRQATSLLPVFFHSA